MNNNEIERLREENQMLKDTLKACLKEGVKTSLLNGEISLYNFGCGCCSGEPLNITPEQIKLIKDLAKVME